MNQLNHLSLILVNNHINAEGALDLGKSISNLNQLSHLTLDLTNNDFKTALNKRNLGYLIYNLNQLNHLTLDLLNIDFGMVEVIYMWLFFSKGGKYLF